jgi:hypothetical protein
MGGQPHYSKKIDVVKSHMKRVLPAHFFPDRESLFKGKSISAFTNVSP